MMLFALAAAAFAQPANDLAFACVDAATQEGLALEAGDLDGADLWAAEADRVCADFVTVVLDGAPLDQGIVFDAGDGLVLDVVPLFQMTKAHYYIYIDTPPPPPPPTTEQTACDDAPPPADLVREVTLPAPRQTPHIDSWASVVE